MSQVFDEKGNAHPVTILSAGPVVVTQIKTKDKDGYEAVQIGYGEKKAKNINKAITGHLKGLGNFRFLREFKIEDAKGVSDASIRKAISLGICKVNVDTDLRMAFDAGVRKYLAKNPADIDPRHILGEAKEFMTRLVRQKMRLLGSSGKV